MAKETASKMVLERTYTIPLRREFLKVPTWRRTEKAVVAVQEFLRRHMKSAEVKMGKALNEELWKHGIRNPPHHVKITAVKDEKGVVRAELFGVKVKAPAAKAKKAGPKAKEEVVETAAKEPTEEKKPAAKKKKAPKAKEE
jgi:large subunit ribosomal protein L31e